MTLLEDWRQFEDNVLPDDFGAYQRRTAKLAFYAGASTILDRILCVLAEGPIDALAIRDLRIECQEVANSIAEDAHR